MSATHLIELMSLCMMLALAVAFGLCLGFRLAAWVGLLPPFRFEFGTVHVVNQPQPHANPEDSSS